LALLAVVGVAAALSQSLGDVVGVPVAEFRQDLKRFFKQLL
jgi:hypothetical protein